MPSWPSNLRVGHDTEAAKLEVELMEVELIEVELNKAKLMEAKLALMSSRTSY